MRDSLSKALAVGGLTLVVSPFCLVVQAQDYIDLEAERREEAPREESPRREAPADPYSAPATRSYPATSYGVNSAPAGSSVSQSGAATAAPPAATASGSQAGGGAGNVGQLLLQVQQLQQEVMRLNGMVEEQAYELRTLKEQQLERYVDLDRRVSALTTGGAAAPGGGTLGASGNDDTPTLSTGATSEREQPGEGDAYRSAYDLVRNQQFDQAVDAFKAFLRQYPSGRYAANAHYWLGELYLVVQPPDLEASRQSFSLLLQEYPDNAKVPDALYKLGRVQYMKGNRERAREYLDRVIREYGDSNNSAVRLAQDFIDENY